MAKKHKHPEHVNHERWLVSYADFITLLFAFFVVMFSTSQTDSNKVGRFSESFVESMGIHVLQGSVGVFDGTNSAFSSMKKSNIKYLSDEKGQLVEIENNIEALQSMLQAGGGDPEKMKELVEAARNRPGLRIALGAGASEATGKGKPTGPGGERDGGSGKDGPGSGNNAAGNQGPGEGDIGDVARVAFGGNGSGDAKKQELPVGFRILRRRSELVLRLDNDVLFKSGSDELDPRAVPLLEALGRELKSKPVLVKVEGHADTRPIHTAKYPSNWHLSSARATAVVLILAQKAGISPARLGASGFGEHQPIASNETEEGRAKNRRVDIVIGLDPSVQEAADPEQVSSDVKGAEKKARAAAAEAQRERAEDSKGAPHANGADASAKGTDHANGGAHRH